MNEYRITKYNPKNRNDQGHYLDLEEWTEYSDVGEKVSLDDYEKVEAAYISSALDLVSECEPNGLRVVSLEDYQSKCPFKENDNVAQKDMEAVIRSLLRGEYWCKLESDHAFVHVGWDYYMYVGVQAASSQSISRATERGLYVEEFISPYHPENS